MDDKLLDVLQHTSELYSLRVEAAKEMQDGFFDLARARHGHGRIVSALDQLREEIEPTIHIRYTSLYGSVHAKCVSI
jgi:hypothetical protein